MVVNLDKKGSLAIVRGPIASTQKKTWEVMLNPDVDG